MTVYAESSTITFSRHIHHSGVCNFTSSLSSLSSSIYLFIASVITASHFLQAVHYAETGSFLLILFVRVQYWQLKSSGSWAGSRNKPGILHGPSTVMIGIVTKNTGISIIRYTRSRNASYMCRCKSYSKESSAYATL